METKTNELRFLSSTSGAIPRVSRNLSRHPRSHRSADPRSPTTRDENQSAEETKETRSRTTGTKKVSETKSEAASMTNPRMREKENKA